MSELESAKILGKLQGDIEKIINHVTVLDNDTMVNLLKMALFESEIACKGAMNYMKGDKKK